MSDTETPDFEIRVADWLDAASAQERIMEQCVPLPGERLPILQALGRALAEDIHAEATLPPWDNAGMDGYAVRGEDVEGATPSTPVTLTVTGLTRAGDVPSAPVGSGEAVRIMTGAPVPPGADSVIRVEDTDGEEEPGRVRIVRSRDRSGNVRPGGQDMRPGDKVLRAGDAIHPGTVGVLAALGREEVFVGGAPTVAILTTGDELRGPDAYGDVTSGLGIPESNGPMLSAAVIQCGGVPLPIPRVEDRMDALAQGIARAADAQVLVTVGGASMGEADLVKRALDHAGFRLDFWRVTMRPGSPFSFGWLPRPWGTQPVFGLPGNPSSAYVTFELFVRPFLLRLAGHRAIYRRRVRGVAGEALRGTKRTLFLRVEAQDQGGRLTVRTTGHQGSGLVRGLVTVQALAVLPPGAHIAEGEHVDLLLLDPGSGALAESPLESLPR